MNLGIVGAGQLGRMLAMAAASMNIKTYFVDPSEEASAAIAGAVIKANYDDAAALSQLARQVDAVTLEFENVPPQSIIQLKKTKPVYPPHEALQTARDRWLEKSLFRELGISIADIANIESQSTLSEKIHDLGVPAILKTRTLGYDGKGQKRLLDLSDADTAFSELGSVPCILEGFVDFDYEVSCLGVRANTGEKKFYPIVRNVHREGILYQSTPEFDAKLQRQAEEATAKVMEALNYVGVMAFEFFVRNGELIANEIAPRVHNSGHWTIEGACTSQFENHVRAVVGLPLGETDAVETVTMFNVIGRKPEIQALLGVPGVHWHDYGKKERPGRKIGHVTVTAKTASELEERAAQVESLLRNELA